MTSRDAGATSSSINSPIAPSPMPTLSPAPSLMLSPVSTTSDNPIHRPFPRGLLRRQPRMGRDRNEPDRRLEGRDGAAPLFRQGFGRSRHRLSAAARGA